jgi:hypothetical protein
MSFDQARGELVGPLHGGMRAMFTMMNAARLSIGAQGPAVGERAFQHALHYASDRLQGRARGITAPKRSAIIEHLDVRRMLLSMSTMTQASRLLLYWVGAQGDRARHGTSPHDREVAQFMVDLVTPVAKAWSTDSGFQTASLGIQVLGGAGYIEESGMAQRLRDARIAPIYEGTNGIQALDLVTRKIGRDDGHWLQLLFNTVSSSIPEVCDLDDPLAPSIHSLADSLSTLRSTSRWMIERLAQRPDDAVAGATSYLELFGITLGGWLMFLRARSERARDGEATRAITESNFFALEVMGRSPGLAKPILAGAEHLQFPISRLGL